MGIGGSLFLIAVGAILKFAVTKHVNGLDVGVVGVILMIVGAVGLAITLAVMTTRRRTDVVYRPDGATYVEPNRPIDPRL
jgi:uncharacterized membrane protein YhhN